MVYRESPVPNCPSCHVDMVEVVVGGSVQALQCERCKGIWMDEPRFWALYREHLPDPVVRELMTHNDGTQRRPCPTCHELMDIAWIDFLQLDRCEHAHGVWFDAGELQQALRNEIGHDILAQVERAEALRHAAKKKKYPY